MNEALGLLASELAFQPADSEGRRDLEALRGSIALLATGVTDLAQLRRAADEAFASGRYRTAADRARVVQFALLMGDGAAPALAYVLEQEARFRSARVTGVALEFLAESIQAAILAGRLNDAVTQADELLEQPAAARARQSATVFRARALTLLGRFETAAEGLLAIGGTLTPDYFGSGEALAAQAELAFWSGLPARAVELVDRMLTIPPPVSSAHVAPQVLRAWAAWEAGQPIASVAIVPIRSLAGAVPETEGLRHLQADELDAAAACFREAADLWAGFHRPRELVCQWAIGESLRRAGRGDDAPSLLQATLEAAVGIGFEPLAARVRRSLRQSGVRIPPAPRGASVGRLDLTRRERELVELVELGLTNVEIARRLGLGRPTVARILASAMGKVGADRRTQLAGAVRGP